MERLLDHYENLWQGIVAAPERRLSELRLLSEEEREKMWWSGSDWAEYDGSRCLMSWWKRRRRGDRRQWRSL